MTPTAFDDVPEPPALYITIRRTDEGEVELDIGDLPFESALGLLTMALNEMSDCQPEVLLRSASPIYYQHVCDECASKEEEDE